MNIQIDGTNTKNKGAELMLHGILDQISRVYPKAEVYFNTYYGKLGEIDTSINLKKRKLLFSAYPDAILKKIGFKTTIFSVFHTHKKLDIVFDASGFRFGDQWNHSSYYNDRLQNYMSNLKKNETKIIFLPQAFGPFKTLQGSRSAKIINDYADIIIARESLSQNYLLEAGVDENKVRVNTDFTNIVDGIPPLNNNKYQNTVCIIPNYKMLDKTTLKGNEYINFYSKLIKFISKSGRNVILLNHEQERDYKLCEAIKKNIGSNIEIISGLNALELKGVIGSCYAVISSRYHGVASALSQNVPCLATSWSHKYELLFKDYGLKNQILKVDDKFEVSSKKIKMLIDVNKNAEMREMLKINGAKLKESTCQMWDFIWSINKGK